MKTNISKRILSIFFVMVMVVSMVPLTSLTANARKTDDAIYYHQTFVITGGTLSITTNKKLRAGIFCKTKISVWGDVDNEYMSGGIAHLLGDKKYKLKVIAKSSKHTVSDVGYFNQTIDSSVDDLSTGYNHCNYKWKGSGLTLPG